MFGAQDQKKYFKLMLIDYQIAEIKMLARGQHYC
jgi:hypothetical protein